MTEVSVDTVGVIHYNGQTLRIAREVTNVDWGIDILPVTSISRWYHSTGSKGFAIEFQVLIVCYIRSQRIPVFSECNWFLFNIRYAFFLIPNEFIYNLVEHINVLNKGSTSTSYW